MSFRIKAGPEQSALNAIISLGCIHIVICSPFLPLFLIPPLCPTFLSYPLCPPLPSLRRGVSRGGNRWHHYYKWTQDSN